MKLLLWMCSVAAGFRVEDYVGTESERVEESRLRFILFLALVGDALVLGCLYLCAYVDCTALIRDCSRRKPQRQAPVASTEPESEPLPTQAFPL